MAVTPTVTDIHTAYDFAYKVSWASIANSDNGTAVELYGSADRSVQITGTFGAGGTIVIEGSNDGTNYVTLYNLQASALSFTAAGLKGVAEITRYIRPRVTAGDGTTSLTVTLLARRPSR
jgi:hypothetical protein